MSDIDMTFVVDQVSATFTSEPNELTFNAEPINMTVFAQGFAPAGGSPAEIQFNSAGVLGGIPVLTYDGFNVIVDNIANLFIPGGNPGDYISTDGAGNISFTPIPNTSPGGGLGQLQFNSNGVFGGIPSVTFNNGNLSLGSVANIKLTGGTNGYVLQTDGTGNLTWTAQTGGSGNAAAAGANTQIQYNDSGLFNGDPSFTFNKLNDTVTIANIKIDNRAYVTNLYHAREVTNISNTAATGNVTLNLLDQAIVMQNANATGNFNIIITGNSTVQLNDLMTEGQSITCTFINKNGSTAYTPSLFYIDGFLYTPKWPTNLGAPVSGTVNGYDMYTFNIVKITAGSFELFGSYGGFA